MPFSFDFPPFVAHPLLRSGHAQTIFGNYVGVGSPRRGAIQRQVPMDDGDRLILHDDAPGAPADTRIVLLIHGLGGCHASGYVQRLSQKLRDRGYHPFRLDQRGCGAGETVAAKVPHAGRTTDVITCLTWLTRRFPHAPITACGFSLGAAILLKAIANAHSTIPALDTAIAVSPPIDLIDCADRVPRVYNRFFARSLWRQFLRRRSRLTGADRLKIERRPRSIFEFDTMITAPLSGFESVEAYYAQSSVATELSQIGIPTVVLIAEDDPIVPADIFDHAPFSSQTTLVRAAGGGHLGFVAAGRHTPTETDRRWAEWRVVDWIDGLKSLRSSNPTAVNHHRHIV